MSVRVPGFGPPGLGRGPWSRVRPRAPRPHPQVSELAKSHSSPDAVRWQALNDLPNFAGMEKTTYEFILTLLSPVADGTKFEFLMAEQKEDIAVAR